MALAIHTAAQPRGRSALRMLCSITLALSLTDAACALAGDYKGTPTCDYCGMFISEKAIGARLTTNDNQTLIFDADECMAAFTHDKIAATEIREMRTINYNKPDELIDVKNAWFLQSDKRPSPMAVGLSAYATRKEADEAKTSLGGDVLNWNEVVKLIRTRWFREKVD